MKSNEYNRIINELKGKIAHYLKYHTKGDSKSEFLIETAQCVFNMSQMRYVVVDDYYTQNYMSLRDKKETPKILDIYFIKDMIVVNYIFEGQEPNQIFINKMCFDYYECGGLGSNFEYDVD